MKSLNRNLKILLACIPFLLALGCDNGEKPNHLGNESQKTTYDKVIESGTMRVGYISYPPSFSIDPNTKKLSGIFHDVVIEAGKNLELKIDFAEELDWGTMIESMKTGKVDLVCAGIWPSSTRGKFVGFSSPIYYSPIKAYVRADDVRFDGNIQAINSAAVSISAIDGEMTSIIAQFDFPQAKVSSLPKNADVSLVLLDVVSKKADVTFVEPAIANAYLANNPGTIKEVANVAPLRVFPNVMLLPQGDTRFRSMMNTAIEELVNTGFVDKVIDRYEKYPNSFLRLQHPYRL